MHFPGCSSHSATKVSFPCSILTSHAILKMFCLPLLPQRSLLSRDGFYLWFGSPPTWAAPLSPVPRYTFSLPCLVAKGGEACLKPRVPRSSSWWKKKDARQRNLCTLAEPTCSPQFGILEKSGLVMAAIDWRHRPSYVVYKL